MLAILRRALGGLEQSPRAHVARDVVDGSYGNVHEVIRGVDGVSVALGYTDVDQCSASVFGPKDQVARPGGAGDRPSFPWLTARQLSPRPLSAVT